MSRIIRCKGCGAPKSKPHIFGCGRPTGKPRKEENTIDRFWKAGKRVEVIQFVGGSR